jgi:hypothetical protein
MPNSNINEELIDEIDEIVDSIFSPEICLCGSSDHENTRHPLCSLNPNNQSKSSTKNKETKCKCGSTSHLRTNYKYCRLNKRFSQNSQANQITNLDDLNDLNTNSTNILNDMTQRTESSTLSRRQLAK